MPIELTQPIEIPAVQAKTITKLWIQDMTIKAPSPTMPVNVYVTLVPYDESTGQMVLEQTKTLILDDVLTRAVHDKGLADTLTAIYDQVNLKARAEGVV